MKTGEVAKRLGVSTAAVRQWTHATDGPYIEFLSASARGGKSRQFTDQDVRILAAAKQLGEELRSFEEVRERLQEMQADEWRELPPLPPLAGHSDDIPMVTADAASGAIERTKERLTAEIRTLETQITRLEDQVVKLEDQLDQARQEHKQEAHALQHQLNELLDQRGQLAGQLQAVEAGGQRERTLYRAVLIAAAVLAVVLLAVVLIMATGG